MSFTLFINVFATISFTLIAVILIINGTNRQYSVKLIGLVCLIYALFFLSRLLWIDLELILIYPHFLGVFSPILFLPAPLFYLITRNILGNINGLTKSDLFHFLPATLHAFDMIPFFLKSIKVKTLIAEAIIQTPQEINFLVGGFIPIKIIHFTRILLFFIYLIASVSCVIKFLDNKEKQIPEKWIVFTLIFILAIKFFVLLQYLNLVQYSVVGQSVFKFKEIIVFCVMILILIYSFYNLFRIKLDFNKEESYVKHKFIQKNDLIVKTENTNTNFKHIELDINQRLKKLFEEDRIYLNKNITALELANYLNIRSRDLPLLIQDTYGCSYKDLISKFRIEHAKSEIENFYLDKHTLESLAFDTGFNSRITFFNTFKKETGLSPSEFWKSVK
ncbi:AraC family transcriptional regulator [Belliella aquatica]|nr:helix-turn-helix domain-containing protein [Belliella aquatica]MCH7407365.1 helix-turn-helix domain-containing protein [Belliella aquatica]